MKRLNQELLFKQINNYRINNQHFAIALILLACRTQDSIIFRNTSAYFTKDFGSEFYIRLIMDDVVPLLTIDEKKWMWNLINNP